MKYFQIKLSDNPHFVVFHQLRGENVFMAGYQVYYRADIVGCLYSIGKGCGITVGKKGVLADNHYGVGFSET